MQPVHDSIHLTHQKKQKTPTKLQSSPFCRIPVFLFKPISEVDGDREGEKWPFSTGQTWPTTRKQWVRLEQLTPLTSGAPLYEGLTCEWKHLLPFCKCFNALILISWVRTEASASAETDPHFFGTFPPFCQLYDKLLPTKPSARSVTQNWTKPRGSVMSCTVSVLCTQS